MKTVQTRIVIAAGALLFAPFAHAQDAADRIKLEQKVDQLSAALLRTEQEMDASRRQVEAITAELTAIRSELAARDTAPAAPSEEEQQLHAEIEEQHQVKVESASRLPVQVTGMVLFNAFANRGVVDQVDLTSSALVQVPGESHVSTGGSLRQTILGLSGTGPRLWGARTSGYVTMDFFGGTTASLTGGPAGIVRLHTAAIAADWTHDSVRLGYEAPLISPLSPDSLATVAQPALAWAGNLWTWAPQLAWRHTVGEQERGQWALDLGLLDTQDFGAANSQVLRPAGPGELSGQPSYEARLGWSRGALEHRISLGAGGYYGRQRYAGPARADTWASTVDGAAPLGSRLSLSGEYYRGRGLGSLGGGAYRDVVTYTDASGKQRVQALDAEGGWAQLAGRLTPVLTAHLFAGQDSGSGAELREYPGIATTSPLYFYARNRNYAANIFYRPWASITLSPEYRRVLSWPITGNRNRADIFTLSAGYQF